MRDLIDRMLPRGRQLKTNAHPLVTMTLMRQGDRHLVHFVNLSGHSETAYFDPLPIRHVRVQVQGPFHSAHAVRGGKDLGVLTRGRVRLVRVAFTRRVRARGVTLSHRQSPAAPRGHVDEKAGPCRRGNRSGTEPRGREILVRVDSGNRQHAVRMPSFVHGCDTHRIALASSESGRMECVTGHEARDSSR